MTLKHRAEHNILAIKLRAGARPSSDQEFDVMVIRVELQIVVIVVFGQAQGNDAGPGVLQQKGLGFNSLGVSNQLHRRLNLSFVAAPLPARHEELAREYFLD